LVRIEMLAVGKELLIGRTMDSNAFWIGGRVARLGSMIKEITTVDDDLDEICEAFRGAIKREADFLVVVGGLGPTPDDMTLRGVAQAAGVGLRMNKDALEMIRRHYEKRGMRSIELTPARLKMARLPVGSAPLKNEVGTAPGVKLVVRRTVVFCLPGVPAEMRSIFRSSVEPELKEKIGELWRSYARMELIGVPESALAPALSRELRKHPGAYIKSHPRGMKEGASRIVLDIAVVGTDAGEVDAEAEVIAKAMSKEVAAMGGRVGAVKGSKRGDEGWR
jgi:nicotinamide-nucleotide amidase